MLTFAEDATARPDITRPARSGGLGFDYKWDLGWVHDTLQEYMPLKPTERPQAHTKLVFRMHYAFNENYLLHALATSSKPGQKSLLAKMPGGRVGRTPTCDCFMATCTPHTRAEAHVHG